MGEPVVTIGEAAAILGVSDVALRQWTDEGRIAAFVTPGGHRRYLQSELEKFMSSPRKAIAVKELITGIEATGKLHSEIGRTALVTRDWYNRLHEDGRLTLARLGREMLRVIVDHLDEPAQREETLKRARDVGRGFGSTLANLGLPLLDAVEAFVLHRDPIMTVIAHLIQAAGVHSGKLAETVPLTARILDQALLSLVAAHQKTGGSSLGKEDVNNR